MWLVNNSLNGQPTFDQILRWLKQRFPGELLPSKRGLSDHKNQHVLSKPITVEDEETGELQYYGGQKPLAKITVTPEQIPDLPGLPDLLRVIIGAGVHNILHDPASVSPAQTILAIDLLRKIEGGGDDALALLQNAFAAAQEKKRAKALAAQSQVLDATDSGWSVDAMISEAENGT
jgi:hypothetical protein